MAFEFKPGRYFEKFWMLGDGKSRDFLAAVYQDQGQNAVMMWRFRYYVDDKRGEESADRRNWYVFERPTVQELREAMDDMVAQLQKLGWGEEREDVELQTADPAEQSRKMSEHTKTSKFMTVEHRSIH